VSKVIFLDFDGVIRVDANEGGWSGGLSPIFCPTRMRRVAECCEETDAKVVVSSDWRSDGLADILKEIGRFIPRDLLHETWATPILGHRWQEVKWWLSAHPEVTRYAILEDMKAHFDGAHEDMKANIVWCNNRFGFVEKLKPQLINLLNP
jgi:hypothetical protein